MPESSVTNKKLGLKSMKTGIYNITRSNQLDYISGYFSQAILHTKNTQRKEKKRIKCIDSNKGVEALF